MMRIRRWIITAVVHHDGRREKKRSEAHSLSSPTHHEKPEQNKRLFLSWEKK